MFVECDQLEVGNNYLISPLTVPSYLKQAGNLEIKVFEPSGIAV